MTSKIKVDNIENQCGGAVVTKCGATTTISGSVVKADDIQAADGGNLINQCGTTITLGASGDTINLASGASQTGFGRTGTVDWDTTPKTATFSAVSGNGYFCNTSGGAFTVNLPAGSAGDIISLADYAATWQTNALTVSPNGSEKIGSVNADVTLNTEGQSVTFVYVDSTQGWINTMDSTSNVRGSPFIVATGGTITTCGNDKIHTFTGPGTFAVSSIDSVNPSYNNVSYLVIAGGGGTRPIGGGGGAGGFREFKGPANTYTASPLEGSTPITLEATSYPITVGAGGARGNLNPGSNSVFSSITSAGGGSPADSGSGVPAGPNANGGSGGGGMHRSTSAGSGNTPPVSPSQGNPGAYVGSTHYNGNGGGGASEAGQAGGGSTTSSTSGRGGAGTNTQITGGPVAYAGGGGGGGYVNPGGAGSPCGTGGAGGPPTTAGTSGTVNTGGGAGGSGESAPACSGGGSGGSGVVIIRYRFQ